MDHQLIAKITQIVMEKIAQAEGSQQTSQQPVSLSEQELQEWTSFQLLNNQPQSFTETISASSYPALTEKEVENWHSLQSQLTASAKGTSSFSSSKLIAFDEYL